MEYPILKWMCQKIEYCILTNYRCEPLWSIQIAHSTYFHQIHDEQWAPWPLSMMRLLRMRELTVGKHCWIACYSSLISNMYHCWSSKETHADSYSKNSLTYSEFYGDVDGRMSMQPVTAMLKRRILAATRAPVISIFGTESATSTSSPGPTLKISLQHGSRRTLRRNSTGQVIGFDHGWLIFRIRGFHGGFNINQDILSILIFRTAWTSFLHSLADSLSNYLLVTISRLPKLSCLVWKRALSSEGLFPKETQQFREHTNL